MKNKYENSLLTTFNSLQKDLTAKKINEEEFNFLLGVLLKNQVNNFISSEVESLLPTNKDEQSMTMISYKRDRKFSHA